MFNYRSFLLDAIISANYDAVERNYINKNMQKYTLSLKEYIEVLKDDFTTTLL